jgi:histidinol phosphatase-like enzyme (inositol monophosphatase family)
MAEPPSVTREMLELAIDLATRGGDIALQHFASAALHVETKSDGTPVTVADREVERMLRAEIQTRFPADAVLGEEEGAIEGSSGRRWVIDPIDGTRAFMRGVPLFSTLLALHDEHGPAIGVVRLPALATTVAAGRGLGCFRDGNPVRVSSHGELRGAVVTSSAFEHWPEPMLLAVKRAGCLLRTWGDGYGYYLVATGAVDAMVDPEVSAWDMAPMPVLIAEAGGRFSALDGSNRYDAGSGLATNGRIHEAMLAALAAR